MTKKIEVKMTEINVPYDSFISSIDGIAGTSFINNNDYHYKKVLVTEFGIVL